MPFEMSNFVQSVVVQRKLYVGGGVAGSGGDNYTVMMYAISSGTWATLPLYRARLFAMTVINHHLVLVGGYERSGGYSKVLGMWGADWKAWSHPYPDMPTARENPSVVVSNDWLVVAGGYVLGGQCSLCVEVLNTDSKQWYSGLSTPTPWSYMRTAVVGKTAYFMGGFDSTYSNTNKVYCVSIPILISHITSKTSSGDNRQIWKDIPGLKLTHSTPLSMADSLLAVGGEDKDGDAVTAIHHYQTETAVWVKVGDLPSPRCACTCAMTTDSEVLVAGGWDERGYRTGSMDLAQIAQ